MKRLAIWIMAIALGSGAMMAKAGFQEIQIQEESAAYTLGVQYAPSHRYHEAYLDVDLNESTGWVVGGIGADYLIRDSRLYRYRGPGWRWDFVAKVPLIGSGSARRWQVPKRVLATEGPVRAFFVDYGLDRNAKVTGPVYSRQVPWRPRPGVRWQWQLTGKIDVTVNAEVFDVDLFDTPVGVIRELHRRGRKVVCYFSAGSYEDWRPDAAAFPDTVLGKPLNGWPGEWWLDIRQMNVLKPIMARRINLAKRKGCDGVEPDNVDGYANDTGFPLSAKDQIRYNRMLARLAHDRNLSVALKNALELVHELEPYFDWALNEQCFSYQECGKLTPFVQVGKAVLGVSYVNRRQWGRKRANEVCRRANHKGFSWLIKTWNLDAWRIDCRTF